MMNAAHEKLVEEEKKRTAGVDLASRMRGKGPKEIREGEESSQCQKCPVQGKEFMDFL